MSDNAMKGQSDHRASKRQKRWDTPMDGQIDYGVSTLASEKELDEDSVGTVE